MEEKRTIKIELEIDDCKDCPHVYATVTGVGESLEYFCAADTMCLKACTDGAPNTPFDDVPIPSWCPQLKQSKQSIKYAPVTLQYLSNVGLNPFAVKLLAESYALQSECKPVAFSYEGEKNGKSIVVYVRLDPDDPTK